MLHNLLGYALGYLTGRALRLSKAQMRTLSIEVGMQNSGLATSLATVHFAAMPLAAVPGAVFSVWHNISGAVYANILAARPAKMPSRRTRLNRPLRNEHTTRQRNRFAKAEAPRSSGLFLETICTLRNLL